jgi:hypothetical protein
MYKKEKTMKILSLMTLAAVLFLNACSPFTIVKSTGVQPEPVVEYVPAVDEEPASVGDDTTGYDHVTVDSVDVEVGVGSPIPVFVHVSGVLPDTCAQLEYVRTVQDGSNFIIALGTTPSTDKDCAQDTLPFRMSIPLNILDLPVGKYTAEVNSVRGEFTVANSVSTGDLRTAEMPNYRDDIHVDNVSVDVGVGSPIPVHAVISANLPKSCGQLGEVQLKRDGSIFFVRLSAELPAQTDCNNDSLPFRLEIPLNIVNLPEGTYEVNVNGASTTFDIPVQ